MEPARLPEPLSMLKKIVINLSAIKEERKLVSDTKNNLPINDKQFHFRLLSNLKMCTFYFYFSGVLSDVEAKKSA